MTADEPKSFTFLVPGAEAPELVTEDGFGEGSTELERQVKGPFFGRGKEVQVTDEQLEKFWKDKVVALTNTLAASQSKRPTKGFRVEEISFGLGVSATGGVLFVAAASVQASISVTLRRVDPTGSA